MKFFVIIIAATLMYLVLSQLDLDAIVVKIKLFAQDCVNFFEYFLLLFIHVIAHS